MKITAPIPVFFLDGIARETVHHGVIDSTDCVRLAACMESRRFVERSTSRKDKDHTAAFRETKPRACWNLFCAGPDGGNSVREIVRQRGT